MFIRDPQVISFSLFDENHPNQSIRRSKSASTHLLAANSAWQCTWTDATITVSLSCQMWRSWTACTPGTLRILWPRSDTQTLGGVACSSSSPYLRTWREQRGYAAAAIKECFMTTSSLTCSMATAVNMITASDEREGSWSSRKAQTPELWRHLVPTVSMTRLWAKASRALPRVCRTRASDRTSCGHWRSGHAPSGSRDEFCCSKVRGESRRPEGGDAVEKSIV